MLLKNLADGTLRTKLATMLDNILVLKKQPTLLQAKRDVHLSYVLVVREFLPQSIEIKFLVGVLDCFAVAKKFWKENR